MRYRVYSIAAALALAGCAHDQEGVRVVTKTVTVEVMRPCPVEVPERPKTLKASDLPPDARDALRIAIAALLGWQGDGGYGDKADAALRICTKAQH